MKALEIKGNRYKLKEEEYEQKLTQVGWFLFWGVIHHCRNILCVTLTFGGKVKYSDPKSNMASKTLVIYATIKLP
jgi:hypothetical protein